MQRVLALSRIGAKQDCTLLYSSAKPKFGSVFCKAKIRVPSLLLTLFEMCVKDSHWNGLKGSKLSLFLLECKIEAKRICGLERIIGFSTRCRAKIRVFSKRNFRSALWKTENGKPKFGSSHVFKLRPTNSVGFWRCKLKTMCLSCGLKLLLVWVRMSFFEGREKGERRSYGDMGKDWWGGKISVAHSHPCHFWV